MKPLIASEIGTLIVGSGIGTFYTNIWNKNFNLSFFLMGGVLCVIGFIIFTKARRNKK